MNENVRNHDAMSRRPVNVPANSPDLGYASSAYAHTCAHLGDPRLLPRSGVSVLVRRIEVPFGVSDACATYPLLCTEHWRELAADLEDMHDLLSFVAVVDPLAAPAAATLETVFPDRLLAFKSHHIARLDPRAPLAHIAADHRRKARHAAQLTETEIARDPVACASDWVRLYGGLRVRHGFAGAADFPATALAAQLALPGMMLVQAWQGSDVVSMSLWFVSGAVAHYHLGASDAAGYAANASYATFARALEQLAARGVQYVDLGGAAGDQDRADGLARFKRGWANETRTAWLGGRILDRERYSQLCAGRVSAAGASAYFPAYRAQVAA